MSVHYKFKNNVDYQTIKFDGVHISVGDLKKAIIQQRKLSSIDCDYNITDAATKVVYGTDDTLVPKNSSVIVCRIPLLEKKKSNWNRGKESAGSENRASSNNKSVHVSVSKITKASDRTRTAKGEDELIKDMIAESTEEYDSSYFARGDRRGPPGGPLPSNYVCYRCNQTGHHIKQCPTNNLEMKRSTGIPRSFMVPCDPAEKGAYMTPDGGYARSAVEAEAYSEATIKKPPATAPLETRGPEETTVKIPPEISCSLCFSLLRDAVLISCCAEASCDDCIRNILIESDDHECPLCHTKNVPPDTLIPAIKLRKEVTQFLSETDPLRRMTMAKVKLELKSSDDCKKSINEERTTTDGAVSEIKGESPTSSIPQKTDLPSSPSDPLISASTIKNEITQSPPQTETGEKMPQVGPEENSSDERKKDNDEDGDMDTIGTTVNEKKEETLSSVVPQVSGLNDVPSSSSLIPCVELRQELAPFHPEPDAHRRIPSKVPPWYSSNNNNDCRKVAHEGSNIASVSNISQETAPPLHNGYHDGQASFRAPHPPPLSHPGLPYPHPHGHGYNGHSYFSHPPPPHFAPPHPSLCSYDKNYNQGLTQRPPNPYNSYDNNFTSAPSKAKSTNRPVVSLPETSTYGRLNSLPYDQAFEQFQRALDQRSSSRSSSTRSDAPSASSSSSSRSSHSRKRSRRSPSKKTDKSDKKKRVKHLS